MTELWVPFGIGLTIGLTIAAVARFHQRAERERSNPPTLGPSGRVALLGVPSLDALQTERRASDVLQGRVAAST